MDNSANDINNHSGNYYAAVDLGSNSFHMAIAQYDGKAFQTIGKLKKKVQLASGLDANNRLSKEAMQRGWDCLKLFAERLKDIPLQQIKIVATYTLRKAVNANAFIKEAEKILSVPIEILPGTEEARLIYNGVSHNHPDIDEALVIDIGGGSTEIILGKKFQHQHLDSLPIGCVTFKQYFPDGAITEANFQQAILNASLMLSPFANQYKANLWQHCLGSSGSIEAVFKVLKGFGHDEPTITKDLLYFLKDKLIEIGLIDNVKLEGLSSSRINTFATGLAILIALFEEFQIPKMYVADASLREGILLELLDELKGFDNRNQTISSLEQRFNIDIVFANQVKDSAQLLFDHVSDQWGLYDPHYKNLLDWSCLLHEIGLSISYSRLRYHSAHIIQYADMPGFSMQTKESLAAIVFAQHKQLILDDFDNKYEPAQALIGITQILRLAILFNIKRNALELSELEFHALDSNNLLIEIPQSWQQEQQLITFELEKEQRYWQQQGLELSWRFV